MDLRETLEEEGYEVVGETGRGDTAVELVRELLPDLAILDIKMPGMDGLAAARIINQEKLCGVLVLTAFSQREVVEDARDAGALAYLVKPFQKSDLVPAIEVAIGRFRELRALTGEIDALGEQLAARKAIERAKGLLMDELSMSEQDAFTFIQRTAMSERSKMRQIAERILDGTAAARREQAAAPRRELAHVPGVLRPAGGHGDGERADHQRRVRVHVDVHQRAQGATPRRRAGGVRPAGADVPPRSRRRRTRRTATPPPTSSASRWGWCARCSTRSGWRRASSPAGRPTTSSPPPPSRRWPGVTTSSSSPATATCTSSSRTPT